MKNVVLAAALALFTVASFAQQPPQFLMDTYPTHALKQALDAQAVLQGNDAQLDAKTRELISLGVAAQIPCTYCVYAHTVNARAYGASEAEIREEGSAWTFDKSPDEVWDACRRVVSQYEGILAADATNRNGRRILFVHGSIAPIKHSKRISQDPTFNKFLEAWIVVSVRAEQGGRSTSVAAAWISPTTGEAVPVNAPELML